MTKSSVSLTWESKPCSLRASSPFGEVVKSGGERHARGLAARSRVLARLAWLFEGGYSNGQPKIKVLLYHVQSY